MAFDRSQYVAQQLRALAPDAEWNKGDIDRASELANIFVRNGIIDVWRLAIIPTEVVIRTEGQWLSQGEQEIWDPPRDVVERSYAFLYDGRQIGYMGTPDSAITKMAFERWQTGFGVAWSATGKGHINYIIKPSQQTGFRIEPVWESSSDAGDIRRAIIAFATFMVGVALPLAGISAASTLGSAIIGAELAATYPTLASIVGNVALSTAFNGGDIGGAVKSAALGAVGGVAGNAVGGTLQAVVDSPLLGAVANTATQTLIRGGDIKTAVAQTVLAQGVSGMTAVPEEVLWNYLGDDGMVIDWGTFDPNAPFPIDDGGGVYFPTDDLDTIGGSGGSDQDLLPITSTGPTGPDYWSLFPTTTVPSLTGNPLGDYVPTLPTPAPNQVYSPQSQAYNPTQIIQGLTQAAMAAIQVVKAFQSLSTKTYQPVARSVSAAGVSVVGSNGLIQTRAANGTVSTSLPPVGIPQATIDGRYVINNGDGTFTLVNPDGTSRTASYNQGTPAAGISTNTLLMIGGGLLAVLALSR